MAYETKYIGPDLAELAGWYFRSPAARTPDEPHAEPVRSDFAARGPLQPERSHKLRDRVHE
jgi:hypothetical protein